MTVDLIRKAEELSLSGEIMTKDMFVELLEIDPESKEAELLGAAARRVASAVTGDRARIWASIGIDYQPCGMNCRFCSFGKEWGIFKDSRFLSEEEIMTYAKRFIEEGADWITLRTTEEYGLDELITISSKIYSKIPGTYKLVANTGDMNARNAQELYNAGFRIIYHPIRLREGKDTPFDPVERGETLRRIGETDLDLAFLVEPVGVEHTNEEMADAFLLAMKYNAKLSGAMARVPVPGTPYYERGLVSDRRLAQIIAVIRLAAGYHAIDICVHPPSRLAMEWGANVVVVDVGAIPRSGGVNESEWSGFSINTAREWFHAAGYTLTSDLIASCRK